MRQWEYKVVSVDYRGRISVEGQETLIGGERRTSFLRRFLDTLGADGWELVSIQPLTPHDAYYILKRQRATEAPAPQTSQPAGAQNHDETLSAL